MSDLAIKTFLQITLANLTGQIPLTVWAQAPKRMVAGTDQCAVVINIPNVRETRISRPRGGGTKERMVTARLSFTWVYLDDQAGGQFFGLLLDAVDKLFNNLSLPVMVTDPVTGETTSLHDLGEQIDTTVADPQLDQGPENYMIYLAEKRLTLKEWVAR